MALTLVKHHAYDIFMELATVLGYEMHRSRETYLILTLRRRLYSKLPTTQEISEKLRLDKRKHFHKTILHTQYIIFT